MIRVPGEGKPHVPPPITPKEVGKEVQKESKGKNAQAAKTAPAKPGIGRGPELDARAIAVRLAALTAEAKKKEIATEEFERILQKVIEFTGLKGPEAAMEEASKQLQKEIELELEKIKKNKDLMDEADGWQKFAELLTRMNKDQLESFLGLLKSEVKAL